MARNCPVYKVDSNNTGLRYALEKCLNEAEDAPIWRPLEPNSYGDFGGTTTTVARQPINASRQNQKGVVTDKEASAGYTSDLTNLNHQHFMEGFMFAAARERATTTPLNTAPLPITAVTVADGYAVNATVAAKLKVGSVVMAQGFSTAANNGVKLVTAVNGTSVLCAGLAAEANPPATASLVQVGHSFAAGAASITLTNGELRLSATGIAAALGVIGGEWIFLGGEEASTSFPNSKGFARVGRISADYLVLDKVSWKTREAQAGTGVSLQVRLGTVIRNEPDPALIERFTFAFERTLGNDADGVMSQYVTGSVANELTINVASADKVTAEFAFVACDSQARSGAQGLLPGSRPALVKQDAFNTSSDVRRLAFQLVGQHDPLFMYATEMTITINNGGAGAKAIGVLGNFDINVGNFEVGGSTTAYFQDVRALNAINNNSDVTMDIILVKNNNGIVYDIPLLTLGGGMLGVELNSAVTIPLENVAAESPFGHTLLYVHFPQLPSWA